MEKQSCSAFELDTNFHPKSGKIVTEPFNYICENSGKELRKQLMAAFNLWLKIPEDTLNTISNVLQILHNASLIIDDIEDDSILRRGRPATHCVFGVPLSINSANYMYFKALDELSNLNNPECVPIFTEQLMELHLGQGMDIYWRTYLKCPTEAEYKSMVICKTGGLFGLGVRLMQLFSSVNKDFKPLLDVLSLLFQIRDDYINLTDISYHKEKTYAEDLTEGKFSYPIIRAIRDFPNDNQVMSILAQHTKETSLKLFCVKHMLRSGILEETVRVLDSLENECLKLIKEYGGNSILEEFLRCLNKTYRHPNGELKILTLCDIELQGNNSS